MRRTTFRPTARRTTKFVVVAALAAIAFPTIVGAVAGGSPVAQRVTGCLKADGSFTQFAVGDTPKTACTATQKQITVANGDITGLTAGTGLTGGGLEGTVGLSIAPKFALPQGCVTGAAAKASASGWYCGSDYGKLKTSVTVGAIDHSTAPVNGSACVGDYASYFPPYSSQTTTSASFSLPTGSYLPTTTASTRWYVNRTFDTLDGEQFTQGYVQMQVIQTRNGVDTTVATWARSESGNSDGTGLPYTQDLGSFVAFSGDTYRIVAQGSGKYCSRARLLSPGIDFTHIA